MTDIKAVSTDNAPAAIGPYSQAILTDSLAFVSGQIPLNPATMELVEGGIDAQTRQVFKNLDAVMTACNLNPAAVVKLTIYLTDLGNFPLVNNIMAEFFSSPYPARATVQVSGLPRGAMVEIDAVLAR